MALIEYLKKSLTILYAYVIGKMLILASDLIKKDKYLLKVKNLCGVEGILSNWIHTGYCVVEKRALNVGNIQKVSLYLLNLLSFLHPSPLPMLQNHPIYTLQFR